MKKDVGKAKGILLIFLTLIFVVYFYTLLHEGGHALAAVLYGGNVDRFVLGFDAHVTVSGANFTRTGESLFNSAGVLLPVIILAAALIFYNRNVNNIVYHCIYGVFTVAVTGSLLPWLAIPVISLYAEPPAGDDVSKFLETSGLNPLLVSFSALLLIILLILFVYKKGLYQKLAEIRKLLTNARFTGTDTCQKNNMVFVIVIVFICAGIFAIYQKTFSDKVFETSFTRNVRDDLEVLKMPFTVEKDRSYSMDLRLDAEGILTDIVICDDKGNTVYQSICEQLTSSHSLELKHGNYFLMLTFIKNPGNLAQYFEEKGYAFSRDITDEFMKVFTKNRDNEIPVSFSAVIQ